MKDLQVTNGSHSINDLLHFDTTKGKLTLTPKDALEIAYTLFDWADQPYDPIYKVDNIINERSEQ